MKKIIKYIAIAIAAITFVPLVIGVVIQIFNGKPLSRKESVEQVAAPEQKKQATKTDKVITSSIATEVPVASKQKSVAQKPDASFAKPQPNSIEHGSLDLAVKNFEGMYKYYKGDVECKDVKIPKGRPIKNDEIMYYNLDQFGIDIFGYIDRQDEKKLNRVKLDAAYRNDVSAMAMFCLTYVIMRVLQPDLQSHEGAIRDTANLWKSSKLAPFKMSYYFNTIVANSGGGLHLEVF